MPIFPARLIRCSSLSYRGFSASASTMSGSNTVQPNARKLLKDGHILPSVSESLFNHSQSRFHQETAWGWLYVSSLSPRAFAGVASSQSQFGYTTESSTFVDYPPPSLREAYPAWSGNCQISVWKSGYKTGKKP